MSSLNTSGPMNITAPMKTRHADRDVARQVALLKEAVARYGGELADFLPGTTGANDEPAKPGEYRLYSETALVTRLENAKKGTERLLESDIRRARKIGAIRRMPTAPSVLALDDLSRDYPHFTSVVDLLRQRAALAQVTPGRVFALPPILLVGDAGVGKTAFAEAVARCIGLPTRRIDMASSTASFVLAGSHSSWHSARPGAVWTLLHDSRSSGVMLVDEIDKAAGSNHPPTGPLYSLLEPVSARAFMDEYVEVEIDASRLLWIATCNDASNVEPALRSRFREFVIDAPTNVQMKAIARSVYRERRRHAPWGDVFPEHLDERAIETMSTCTPRELAALIEAAAAHAASCHRTTILPADVDAARAAQRRQSRQVHRLGFL